MVKFMSDARQQLLTLLSQQSFRLGQFKLSSGAISDYYIDCRATTLHAQGACLTGRVFLDEIERCKWRPQAIGGLTMGADPIVVSVAMLSAQETRLRSADAASTAAHEWIHGFLVRKSEKAHGTGQRVEGFREKGARVVIVDDDGLDGVCRAFADIIDAKSPFTYRHSNSVADFSRAVAIQCRFVEAAPRRIYRAELLHDLGNLRVTIRILVIHGPMSHT
mgnify:CR=1 FL=1